MNRRREKLVSWVTEVWPDSPPGPPAPELPDQTAEVAEARRAIARADAAAMKRERLLWFIGLALKETWPPPRGWSRESNVIGLCWCVRDAAGPDGWASFDDVVHLTGSGGRLARYNASGALRSARDSHGLVERDVRGSRPAWRLTARGDELLRRFEEVRARLRRAEAWDTPPGDLGSFLP